MEIIGLFTVTNFGLVMFADSFTGFVANPAAVEKIGTAVVGVLIASAGFSLGI